MTFCKVDVDNQRDIASKYSVTAYVEPHPVVDSIKAGALDSCLVIYFDYGIFVIFDFICTPKELLPELLILRDATHISSEHR